jgi:hypothetical protein
MACQWSGKNTQAVSAKCCSARRSWITRATQANSEWDKIRRLGNTRQVIQNHRSETTRRRRRDMARHYTFISYRHRAYDEGRKRI